MTTLAHEYTIVRSDTVIAEYLIVPAGDDAVAAVDDVPPMPWGRIAVGATVGVIAATALGLHHTGFADPWVLAVEIMIAATGLGIMGSFLACLSSIPSRSDQI